MVYTSFNYREVVYFCRIPKKIIINILDTCFGASYLMFEDWMQVGSNWEILHRF